MRFKVNFSTVETFYRAFLELAVYLSSSLFLYLALIKFFPAIKNVVLIFAIISLLILRISDEISKPKQIKIINYYLWKTIAIIGSLFVLLLFANSYLTISSLLNRFFLNIWQILELGLNVMVIALVAFLVFILVYFYVALKIVSFAVRGIKDETKKEQLGAVGFILLLTPLFYANAVLKDNGIPYSWIDFLYSKLNWLFGFSLIFLHLNYLVKEVGKFLKVDKTQAR